MEEKIDAVYTWVDMNDKKWRDKFKKYTGKNSSKCRHQNYNELFYSIKLLNKNCNFIRKIFIVTDDQIPNFIHKFNNVQIIDHSQILGDECIKPTFKSNSIESYLHNIPNLTENFLYLNDDCFIGNKCFLSDFIKNNKPVARFKTIPLNNNIRKKSLDGKIYSRGAGFSNAMLCIKRKYTKHFNLAHIHQVTILNKTICKKTWEIFRSELILSVSERTRDNRKHTIPFVYLVLLHGIVLNFMIPEINKYSVTIFNKISFSENQLLFNELLRIKPKFFCINDINSCSYPRFYKTMEYYIK